MACKIPIFVGLCRSTSMLSLGKNQKIFIRNFNYQNPYKTMTPEYLMKTFQERLQEEGLAPCIDFNSHVDIGLPSKKTMLDRTTRLQDRKVLKENEEIRKLTLSKEYVPDIENIREEWEQGIGKAHVREVAAHYGIYEHLFGPEAFFYPEVQLKIKYETGETLVPVYFGNVIKPKECAKAPEVSFSCSSEDLWTLVLTNPDGNMYDSNKECLHWLIANIPGGNVADGEVICDYLPPFPPKGVGYQRFVYVLYKQAKKIDLSSFQVPTENRYELQRRTFSTYDFYRQFEDDLTPAGLAFHQSDYDYSVRSTFHNQLNMKEPIYEYDFSNFYPIKEQEWFPKRRAFNLYLDRYRDPKEIAKEKLLNKLKKVNPLGPPQDDLKYPLVPIQYGPKDPQMPSWYRREKQWEFRKSGKYADGFLE